MWQYIGYGNWAWSWDWRHSHKAYIHIASQHIRRSLWGEAASHPGDAAEPFGNCGRAKAKDGGGNFGKEGRPRMGAEKLSRGEAKDGSGKAI